MTLSFALKTIAEVFAVILLLVGIWYEEEIAEWEQKVISKIKGESEKETRNYRTEMARPEDRSYEERRRLAESAAYGRMQAAKRENRVSARKDTVKEQKYVA